MARRLGIVLLVVLAMAATAAPSQSTTSTTSTTPTPSTTSTTSTTMPAPTTTTAPPTPPPLPSCREVLASDPKGSISDTRIRIVGLPTARRLTVDLHYTGGAGGVDVRNCVSLLSSGGEEVATQDTLGLCCVSFDHRFSVLLPHQPAPGTKVCAQEALRETFADGLDVGFSLVFTNRACQVMPGTSPGELPFTGPAHTVPLAALAALAIVLGVAVLLAARGPQQRS